jgi:hypothetical protein
VLLYDIANERLMGTIGNERISLWARAGGGRASTTHSEGQAGQLGLAAWDTQRQLAGNKRGGPLPIGVYVIHKPAHHPHLGLAAYLEQTVTSLLYEMPSSPTGISVTKRGGFYIHGRGPKGSDGCIVPMESFSHLMQLLTTCAPIALKVINAGARTDKLPPPIPDNLA